MKAKVTDKNIHEAFKNNGHKNPGQTNFEKIFLGVVVFGFFEKEIYGQEK
jgi:hypothetical protein